MRPECQLRAFNAEVTASPIIAPPPYPHSCPPVLVLLFGTTGRAALEGVLFFPLLGVGPKDLSAPAHFNVKPKAQAKEENVRR